MAKSENSHEIDIKDIDQKTIDEFKELMKKYEGTMMELAKK